MQWGMEVISTRVHCRDHEFRVPLFVFMNTNLLFVDIKGLLVDSFCVKL